MPEKTSYRQLQPEERLTIASLHLQGMSMRTIAHTWALSGNSAVNSCETPRLLATRRCLLQHFALHAAT